MTLTEYPDLLQGSDEWLEARRGLVTASVVGKLITARTVKPASNDDSRALTALLAAERITGWVEPTFTTSDMMRGVEDEPRARDLYAEHFATAPVRESGFMVRDDWGFRIGYSPDGLVGEDGLIECKSRRPKGQLQTILANEVPPFNKAQLQCGLLVTGRAWIDYVSYAAGMPLFVKRELPDPRWFEAILAAVSQLEDTVAEMVRDFGEATKGLPVAERFDDLEFSL